MNYRKIIVLLCMLLQPCFVWAKELKLVANIWPPYVSDQIQNNGLAIEIVSEALRRAGYQPVLKIDTWPRALEGSKLGIYDVVAAIWFTKERAKELEFSKPYLLNEIKFLKKKNQKISFERIDDLRGLVVGVVKDYAYEESFIQLREIIKIPRNHVIQNLVSLVQGDIDLTLGDERTIRYELNRYMRGNIKELEFLTRPLSSRGLRIAVSKSNPNHSVIVADFDRVIKKMRVEGRIQKIFSSHGF